MLSIFFNTITGDSLPQRFHKIEAAPFGLRQRILDLIDLEISHAEQGQKAFIRAKVNSLVDTTIIKALYKASQAGVVIELNIRGICCLVPELKGISDNIKVISLVDRFLEHARIVHFHNGGNDRVYISSADWMPRNLDRRLELLVPIEDRECRDRLIELLQVCLRDRHQARQLHADGTYTTPKKTRDHSGNMRAQEYLQKEAERLAIEAEQKRTILEPYISSQHTQN